VGNEKLKTRNETVDGVKYLVAPAVMVAEAVLNGELLPAEEIQRSCEGWNGRVLTVKHPQDEDGNDVSANSPEMIEKFGAGYIFGATYDIMPDLRNDTIEDRRDAVLVKKREQPPFVETWLNEVFLPRLFPDGHFFAHVDWKRLRANIVVPVTETWQLREFNSLIRHYLPSNLHMISMRRLNRLGGNPQPIANVIGVIPKITHRAKCAVMPPPTPLQRTFLHIIETSEVRQSRHAAGETISETWHFTTR